MKSRSFTICLLKETVTTFEAALDPDKKVDPYPLSDGLGFSGTLFVGQQNESVPDWVGLLNPFLQTPVARARSASISAVLLLKYDSRMFAVCFGYGKSLLSASVWVRDFGLRVTVNRVDPVKLRSVDTKTYEDLVVSTRKQTSRSSKVDSFELDVARDLVRGVTGDSADTTYFKRLTGSDSLTLTTELAFEDIGDLLDELLEAYSDVAYRKNFEWIDNIKDVDTTVKEQLDELLISELRDGDMQGMHLAPADVVEWGDIKGFNFTCGQKTAHYLELDLADYMAILGAKRADLSLDQLKRHKVRVLLEGAEELRDMWSVYDCFVWQASHYGKQYMFFDGRWFEVEQSYATRVADYVKSVSAVSIQLPEAKFGDDEGKYNETVAKSNPARFALLDRQTVRPGGAASPIEFCDLMSDSRHLIHVKKRSSSATLSHLFSQGSVSCDVFMQDPVARREVKAKLRKLKKKAHATLIPTQRPTPSDFEVVYAVLAKAGHNWPPRLPFFSAVNLMHHARRIQNLGFKVSLQHVKQV